MQVANTRQKNEDLMQSRASRGHAKEFSCIVFDITKIGNELDLKGDGRTVYFPGTIETDIPITLVNSGVDL